jgi:hypothetical protein
MAFVVTMPKPKPAATTDGNVEKEADLVHILIPIFKAHVLLGIASDLEDDQRYGERAKVLIGASHHHVDSAFKLVEALRERGGAPTRKRGTA